MRLTGFEDTTKAAGTDDEVMSVFRRVQDEIQALIEYLPDSLMVESSCPGEST